MKRFIRFFLATVAISLLLCPYLAQAEFYVAGQVGATFPEKISNVQGTGLASGLSFSDLALQTSVIYGGKVGYFFDRLKWLGIEAEAFTTTPHVKQQAVTACAGAVCTPPVTTPGSDLRVTTLAFNLIARYPGERFQPYVGAGLGVFFAENHVAGVTHTDEAVPGANALGGVRFFLTKHLALFGEYKFQYVHFNFEEALGGPGLGISGDYKAHNAVGGIAWHF